MRQEAEPFSFPLAAFYPWQSYQERQLTCQLLDTAKEGNHSERVGRRRLIQVSKLVLVCLRLCKEDLFTLLLHCGYVHHSMEVDTLEVAEKLHLMPHELVNWHESRFLGRT